MSIVSVLDAVLDDQPLYSGLSNHLFIFLIYTIHAHDMFSAFFTLYIMQSYLLQNAWIATW